ncbi:tetratricopeptide repeat protein [Polynucleobacter sp. CS-Odin-A6]|uniref:tetratricopeptide repeat protein n=1 Tax=Polynucleobacter sp. CS-Odin-A6 TaxID=2689106 RepID=UPI001C0BF69E|nr:tetratricopeptide repeat protein [Polynucleobacter sp. CS-Odin-A6]MBU3621324.1 tetratricopeptide repeat protein [Polynucleobacter sp. CS-Odin-A6]
MTANIFSIISQGVDQFQIGNLDNAERLISTALKIQPKNPDALQILGVIKNLKGEHEEGVRLLKKAISLDPSNGFIHMNLAKALSDTNKDFYALPHHQQAIRTMSENPNVWLNYGVSLVKLHRQEEALVIYESGLKLHSNTANLWINMSGVLNELLRHEEAIAAAQQAISIDLNQAEAWCNLGSALSSKNKFSESLEAFDHALALSPDLLDVWINRSKVLLSLNQIDEAIYSCRRALEIEPESAAAWLYLGNGLQATLKVKESIEAYCKSLESNPNSATTLSNLGVSLKFNKDFEDAKRVLEEAIATGDEVDYLLGNYLSVLMHLCDWENYDSLCEKITQSLSSGKNAIMPFDILSTPIDLSIQKKCAEQFVQKWVQPHELKNLSTSKIAQNEKKRIGYFSFDFKEHPVGILMSNIIALHDRSQFEIYGFFLNNETGDDIEKSLLELFDQSFNLARLSDPQAIALIRDQKLDIAIDLSGHTSGARMSLFSKRLAPIQANFLGYAGTTGTKFFDYLIADQIAIPSSYQTEFTEKIAHLPNSFFPVNLEFTINDLGNIPSRKSQNLPDQGVVFGCFNNAYKISPKIFITWMSILKEVPNSVLWLSQMPEKTIENLKREAQRSEVDPERLIFAIRTPSRKDHLNRLRLMDLFLDTPHYNAHATAADALTSGVPIITLLGDSFAGRVAASQLTAANLPELITHSLEEYCNKAIELAQKPEELALLRKKLAASHLTAPLFNSSKYVRDLEELYLNMAKSSQGQLD